MSKRQVFILVLFLFPVSLLSVDAVAQSQFQAVDNDPLSKARMYTDLKQYDKAEVEYKAAYEKNPGNHEVYREYFHLLITMKEFKKAEKILDEQLKYRQRYPLLYVDAGRILDEQGKTKKAEVEFERAIDYLTGDDITTQRVANAFEEIGRDDYALKTYEEGKKRIGNAYMYSAPLAKLYAKKGDMYNAVGSLIEGGVNYNSGIEDVEATLLELIGTDKKKIQLTQKALFRKVNEYPDNAYYPVLLTWIYTQKGDWEGALMQIEAIDARLRESGQRILELARFAAKEGEYEYALKAYDAVIAKGDSLPYYGIAKGDKLSTRYNRLDDLDSISPADLQDLEKDYETFLSEFPQHYTSPTIRDFAALEAQYMDNPQKGVDILEEAIKKPNARRDFIGVCKLLIGDYLVILGRVWDAALYYGQVDKSFREDVLGEEARFRNAKLAYYRADFAWAQGQLTVLKASTSELIANDALYLSVLITENIPPDSNYVPLTRFAAADLLMFQNKDKEAERILDSISKEFPDHPLKDDILMQRAALAKKHRDYNSALNYFKEVYEKHGDDVLGDDAIFKTAEIYQKNLKQPEKALEFYEKLIIDFPGSTHVQSARNMIRELDPDRNVVP